MRRHPGNSIQAVLVTAVLLALAVSAPVSAGVWKTGEDESESWWYDHQDGTWAVGWELIDGNGDGIGEWYLFDEDGWLITDYMTKDGYEVDQNGAWVQNGQVVRVRMDGSGTTSGGGTTSGSSTTSQSGAGSSGNSGVSQAAADVPQGKFRMDRLIYNDGGSIKDIEAAEDRMVEVLSRELVYCGYRQIISTLLFVVFGGFIMDFLPLGMMDLGKGIFRTLCVGYGLYAIANAMMLILLYFEDYIGSVTATGVFAVTANLFTIWQAAHGDTAYFGAGFMAGAIVYFVIVLLRLEWSTRRLPYLLLGRQAAVSAAGGGSFTQMERMFTRIGNRVAKGTAKTSQHNKDGRKRAVRPRKR